MLRLKEIFNSDFSESSKQINEIEGSPCSSNATAAFDLNMIKNRFCASVGIQPMQSVNSIIFWGQKILLVEFKKSDPDRLLAIRCQYFRQAVNQELPYKVAGSKNLLLTICEKKGIAPNKTPVKSIFLVNLNDRDYLSYMANTAVYRQISFISNDQSAILNCSAFQSFLMTA